jgi:hypothetical protein
VLVGLCTSPTRATRRGSPPPPAPASSISCWFRGAPLPASRTPPPRKPCAPRALGVTAGAGVYLERPLATEDVPFVVKSGARVVAAPLNLLEGDPAAAAAAAAAGLEVLALRPLEGRRRRAPRPLIDPSGMPPVATTGAPFSARARGARRDRGRVSPDPRRTRRDPPGIPLEAKNLLDLSSRSDASPPQPARSTTSRPSPRTGSRRRSRAGTPPRDRGLGPDAKGAGASRPLRRVDRARPLSLARKIASSRRRVPGASPTQSVPIGPRLCLESPSAPCSVPTAWPARS